MKAVILAAGLGSRLRPITNDIPKCMISVNGNRIIDKQINNLLLNDIKDIYVVVGYKSDIVTAYLNEKYPHVHIINNENYAHTNNMYSLYKAYHYIKGGAFLLMNADIYYDKSVIAGLLIDVQSSQIACDKNSFLSESMKITVSSNSNINHISKQISKSDAYALSIDVYKISKDTTNILFEEIKQIIEVNKELNLWTEVALDRILSKVRFIPYLIQTSWCEIDTLHDLEKAENLFKSDII